LAAILILVVMRRPHSIPGEFRSVFSGGSSHTIPHTSLPPRGLRARVHCRNRRRSRLLGVSVGLSSIGEAAPPSVTSWSWCSLRWQFAHSTSQVSTSAWISVAEYPYTTISRRRDHTACWSRHR